jgi:hypothetical protein
MLLKRVVSDFAKIERDYISCVASELDKAASE